MVQHLRSASAQERLKTCRLFAAAHLQFSIEAMSPPNLKSMATPTDVDGRWNATTTHMFALDPNNWMPSQCHPLHRNYMTVRDYRWSGT